MALILRNDLNSAVKGMLAAATAKTIYMIRITDDNPTLPYAILYPLNTGPGVGSWKQPDEGKDFRYQVTCVGGDERQCAAMSSKVHTAMVERGTEPDGYAHHLSVPGANVWWRLCDELGAIIPTGAKLFQCHDIYRVRAS